VKGKAKIKVSNLKIKKRHAFNMTLLNIHPGGDLLSHPVTRIVPLALMGLTSLFGMGRGVSPSLESPG
jgi:hypothetical protein